MLKFSYLFFCSFNTSIIILLFKIFMLDPLFILVIKQRIRQRPRLEKKAVTLIVHRCQMTISDPSRVL